MSGKRQPNCKGRVKVLQAYRADPGATLNELVEATGMSRTAVYYQLCVLEADGVLVRNRQVGRKAGYSPKNTKPNGMITKSIETRDVILKAYRNKPTATISELAAATRYSYMTVYKHMKALAAQGALVREFHPRGKGKRKLSKTQEQRRIDRVVRKAKRLEEKGSVRDVVIDYGIRAMSFHARKVG